MPLGLLSSAVGGGSAGSFELIETQLIGGTSPTSVTFSSIPSSYKHLQLRIVSRWNAGGSSNIVQLRINGDTGSNYSYHGILADGGSISPFNAVAQTLIQTGQAPPSGVVANAFGSQIIDFIDYANTNKNKTIRALIGQHNDYSQHVSFRTGAWYSTSAISSLTIFGNQGGSYFLSGSRLSLYGIKG